MATIFDLGSFIPKRIIISFIKDKDLMDHEINKRANYYLNKGIKAKSAYVRAKSEVEQIVSSQVLNIRVYDEMLKEKKLTEEKLIRGIVEDIAGERDFKYVVEDVD